MKNIIKNFIDMSKRRRLVGRFPFNDESINVFITKAIGSPPNVNEVRVRGKFIIGKTVYFVIWGSKDDDGEWKLMTLTNSLIDGEYDLMHVNGYRLYQMKRFGIELELMNKSLNEVIQEVWKDVDTPEKAQRVLGQRWCDFMMCPTIL